MTGIDRWGSGAPWEESVGYSRVVRARGDLVLVAGCTAIEEDGTLVGEGNPYLQARQALANVERALAQAGASLADVVRTRMFVTDMTRSDEVGRAHGETFSTIRPATSMLGVAALIDPRMMVEIEADAVVATS